MQYREGAVRISQAVLNISRELSDSVGYVYQYQKEGKVSEEEAQAYMEKVQLAVEIMIAELADPVFVHHPDLRPKCCSCEKETDCEEAQ
ncbi:hypothetical protein [Candidatus Pantoea formicae]|uniref:hypothetical protein n=1 Tax=Candidatus Pantoea formicae TaxID=2608355 RepID=UPI003EDA0769